MYEGDVERLVTHHHVGTTGCIMKIHVPTTGLIVVVCCLILSSPPRWGWLLLFVVCSCQVRQSAKDVWSVSHVGADCCCLLFVCSSHDRGFVACSTISQICAIVVEHMTFCNRNIKHNVWRWCGATRRSSTGSKDWLHNGNPCPHDGVDCCCLLFDLVKFDNQPRMFDL